MIRQRLPDLTDLAFEGRNKDYGAYYLRKKYNRTLAVSVFTATIFILLTVLLPFFLFLFEPVPLVEGDILYEVEYYGLMPPPDQELSKLIQALSKPETEVNQAPVVTDSVQPDNREVLREVPPEEMEETDESTPDSAARPGGSGLGAGTGDDTGLATAIDVYPRFPGGDEARLYYLRQHVRYPDYALKTRIQGVVIVVFIIEADGSLSGIEVASKIGGGCDEEAIRVTREMPRWEPGKRNGKPVRVMVRMPIVFRIPGRT